MYNLFLTFFIDDVFNIFSESLLILSVSYFLSVEIETVSLRVKTGL